MDGYYMAYHSLNSSAGPNRSFNVDRVLFNGTQMTVNAGAAGSVKPALPEFYCAEVTAEKFEIADGRAVSKAVSESDFTAEFNFKNASAITLAVNYTDPANYTAIDVDLTAKTVTLSKVSGGAKSVISTGTLVNSFDPSAVHSIRYAQRAGKADIWFDNMQKISVADAKGGGGKIGYTAVGSAELCYTAFSNAAGGISDGRELKQALNVTPAVLYNTGKSKLTAGSGAQGITEGAYKGAGVLTLKNKFDYAVYDVNFKESGFYGLELTYPKAYGGKTVGVEIDGGGVYSAALPKGDTDNEFYRRTVAEFDVSAGIRQIRLVNIGDAFGAISFRFFKSSKTAPEFSHDLSTFMETGADYRTLWKITDPADGHRALAGTRQLVYIGDATVTDFTLSVKLKLAGVTGVGTAGIVFRAGQAAFSTADNYKSIRGYYLSLNNNETRLERLDYNNTERLAVSAGVNASDGYITLKIIARGGLLTAYKNDVKIFETFDAAGFTHGRLGLYTDGAEAYYKDLAITP
jgi:hypothetical protein